MESRNKKAGLGTGIPGLIVTGLTLTAYIGSRYSDYPELPFFPGLWAALCESSPLSFICLGAGLVLIALSVFFLRPKREDYWRTNKKDRLERVGKKLAKEKDLSRVDWIADTAPLPEVRQQAKAQAKRILTETFASGDRNAMQEAFLYCIRPGRLKDYQDILLDAARKYPALIRENRQALEETAHKDNICRHADTPRRYGDCHNDRHHDEINVHDDETEEDKLQCFRPFLPEK